jgi:hypothetical protein
MTNVMSQQRLRPDDLKPGPIRHAHLPPPLIARIEAVRSTLEEVYPMSMAEWLDGFQRDAHPEGEVLWWERVARCYVDYTRHHELQGEQRKPAFNVICILALGANAAELIADLASLPGGALDEIIAIMRSSTPQ